MKAKSFILMNKAILIVVIVGFALTGLTGCGIGRGPYQHGYDGQNHYRGGYGYHSNPSTTTEYNTGNRGIDPTMGYGHSRSGYCSW